MSSRLFVSSGILFLSGLVSAVTHAAEAPANAVEADESQIGHRFPFGMVAQVEDRVITVGDVRRKVAPLLPQIARDSANQAEFMRTLEQAEDATIQNLIDHVLIVKDFYSDEKRRIPPNMVENRVKEDIITEFDNDRTRFLSYLKAMGMTRHDYRREVEEDMIVNWMRGQRQESSTIVSPVQIENYYTENRDKFYQGDGVHLRRIRLSPVADEAPAVLEQTAETIMRELRNGRPFEDLARQYSQDSFKRNGGDWGWFARSDLSEQIAEVAFGLEKGEFSEPIKLQNEIYILYVEEKRIAGIQPLDDVREQIEQILVMQRAREAQERWLERLRRKAYIRYFN